VNLTKRSLESMLAHSKILASVVVIDNASSDETPAFLESIAPKFKERGIEFTVIRNPANVGFGRACNQGIRLAHEKYVAIVNNDTWLMPSWDEVLADVLEEKKLDLVGPHFDERPFADDPVTRANEFLRKNKNLSRSHFVPILMFFRNESLNRLKFEHGGIFDERFFVTFEDTDLKKRMG
jgi:GT2 family glycosyltransferase